MAPERTSRGRQKIEIKKMEDENRLMVTFSKRRYGLFKKASEICTLCGAELAIVVFSPNKKAYTFGHPDIDTVIDRFLTQNPQTTDSAAGSTSSFTPADTNLTRIIDMNRELTGYLDLLKEEKDRGKWLDVRRSSQPKVWWENPIEELNLEQLEKFKNELMLLKENALNEARMHTMEAANPDPFFDFNSVAAAPPLPMDIDHNNNPIQSDPNYPNFGHGP